MGYLSQVNYKINTYLRKKLINNGNRKKIKYQNITLLCNNCLGGFLLHDLGLAFRTPTVNLYIETQDYLTFLEHLESFLSCDLQEVAEPVYPEWMNSSRCPVGKLHFQKQTGAAGCQSKAITIYFIHYPTFQQAKECWDMRKNRINYQHLYVLFQLDTMTEAGILRRFEKLPFANKICLTFDAGGVSSRLLYQVQNRKKNHRIWDYEGINGKRYYDQFDFVGWINSGVPIQQGKNVIIVADCFNVDKLVGSRRVTALASYLHDQGIKPQIITTHPCLYHTTVENQLLEKELLPIRIVSDRFYRLCNNRLFQTLRDRTTKHKSLYERYKFQINPENRSSTLTTIKRILNRILYLLNQLRADRIFDKALAREKEALGNHYAKEVEKRIGDSGERATIITSVGGQSGYYEEASIKMMKILLHKKANVEWIYDMRDKLHTHFAVEERNRIAIADERFLFKHAKYIVAVSYGERQSLIDALGLSYMEAEKIKVVYNGYVMQDQKENGIENTTIDNTEDFINQKTLNIVYTGKAYLGIFHSDMLFQAIAMLIAEGNVHTDFIKFHYAGSDSQAFYGTALKYNCETIFVDHGYITIKEAKRLQGKADILFGMTKNIGSDIGCMPYKIMEYLGYEKPIIVIVTGDVPKAEIKYVLEETRAGIAFDEIDYESNLEQLKEYLLLQYKAKQSFGQVKYQGDRDALIRYSSNHQFFNYLSLL